MFLKRLLSGSTTREPLVVVILSAPRSGTSHFMLRHFAGGAVAGYTEPFNPWKAFGLMPADMEALAEKHGDIGTLQFEQASENEGFSYWRRYNPGLVVDHMVEKARRARKSHIAFKIFPGHCPEAEVAALLRRETVVPLILHRNLLDSWISEEKAQARGRFQSVDTTDDKPVLDINHFYSWHTKLMLWYSFLEVETRHKPRHVLRYEDLYGPSGREEAVMTPVLADIGLKFAPRAGLEQQDKAQDWHDKVGNAEEISAFLDRLKPTLAFSDMFKE